MNSSYPKAKIYSNSTLITSACRNCEDWTEKEIVYSVGFLNRNKLKLLFFVYGDCYAASREVYERVRDGVREGIQNLNLELSDTNELGRVNRVDPLGITNLRIRGMWTIKNPLSVFSEVLTVPNTDFTVLALMRKTKFESFPSSDRQSLNKVKSCNIQEVDIQEPDNPAKLIKATLIKLTR